VSRDRALSIGGFALAIGLGVAAFTIAATWWQTVLLLIVALGAGWCSADFFAYAGLTASAARVRRSEATPLDVESLDRQPHWVRDEAFKRADLLDVVDVAPSPVSEPVPGAAAIGNEEDIFTPEERDRRWPCPCCKYLTLRGEPPDKTLHVCPVCGWDAGSGAENGLSLSDARTNFRLIGAANPRLQRSWMAGSIVRSPLPEEQPWMLRVYELDGDRFSTLDAFFDEISRILMLEAWDHGLDEFDAVLRGDVGTPEGGFILRWKNHALSRERLGYTETVRQLELALARCHPNDRDYVTRQLRDARLGEGWTVFDRLVIIIRNHGLEGDQEDDHIVLILD